MRDCDGRSWSLRHESMLRPMQNVSYKSEEPPTGFQRMPCAQKGELEALTLRSRIVSDQHNGANRGTKRKKSCVTWQVV